MLAVQFRSLISSLLWVYLLKDFRRLNIRLILIVHYFEPRRHMNHAFSSCFVVFYDRLLCFGGVKGFFRDCSRNQVYLHSVGHMGV